MYQLSFSCYTYSLLPVADRCWCWRCETPKSASTRREKLILIISSDLSYVFLSYSITFVCQHISYITTALYSLRLSHWVTNTLQPELFSSAQSIIKHAKKMYVPVNYLFAENYKPRAVYYPCCVRQTAAYTRILRFLPTQLFPCPLSVFLLI